MDVRRAVAWNVTSCMIPVVPERNVMTDIAVIILQKNESLHIKRCLEMLKPLEPRQVFVVDCFSTDGSDKTAAEMGVTVVQHPWPGLYAPQLNWALQNLPIEAEWVMRLDADEYFLPEAIEELKEKLPMLPNDVSANGVIISLEDGPSMAHIRLSCCASSVAVKQFAKSGIWTNICSLTRVERSSLIMIS